MSKFDFRGALGSAVFKTIQSQFDNGASSDGYSKANRYEVVISLPTGASGTDAASAGSSALADSVAGLRNDASKRISFRCDSISMPGRNLRSVMNGNIYGPPHEIVQGLTFSEVAATFYAGSDMGERIFFEEWQKITYNPQTYDINYYKEYVGTIEIYTLNEQDERTYGVKLWEVFPKTIDSVPLSHASTNTINKVGVSFAYKYWTNEATDLAPGKGDFTLASFLSSIKSGEFADNVGDALLDSVKARVQKEVPRLLRNKLPF